MKMLEGKVSIVTGAGSGIGREIALKFAGEGAKVVVSDVNDDGGLLTVSMIESQKGIAFFVKSNSAIPKECESLVDETIKKFGALHLTVNNAGIGGVLFRYTPSEDWGRPQKSQN